MYILELLGITTQPVGPMLIGPISMPLMFSSIATLLLMFLGLANAPCNVRAPTPITATLLVLFVLIATFPLAVTTCTWLVPLEIFVMLLSWPPSPKKKLAVVILPVAVIEPAVIKLAASMLPLALICPVLSIVNAVVAVASPVLIAMLLACSVRLENPVPS